MMKVAIQHDARVRTSRCGRRTSYTLPYDASGYLFEQAYNFEADGDFDQTITFTCDGKGRLLLEEVDSLPGHDDQRHTHIYDPSGRLYKHKVTLMPTA